MSQSANTADLFGSEFGGGLLVDDKPANTAIEAQKPTQGTDTNTSTDSPNQTPQPTVHTFRREIDLGDGSGKQVFEAASAEALIDKLTEAQTNATKKIQELSKSSKARVRPEYEDTTQFKPKQLSADDLFEFTTGNVDPQKLLDKLLESQFGVKSNDVATTLELKRAQDAEREFLASNKEFVPNQENANKIYQFLQTEKLPVTKRNLDYAFQELKADGLLTVNSSNQTTAETRIDNQPNNNNQQQEQKKRSTGVPNIGANREVVREQGDADVEAEYRRILENPNIEQARLQMQRLMARVNKNN